MKLVLDASAAIAAVDPANALLATTIGDAEIVIAPTLFIAEVANGLWKYVNQGELGVETAVRFLRAAADLVNEFRDAADLTEEALRRAAAHRHPVYDLYYVVLARRERAAILTVDGRMKGICRAIGIPLAAA